MMDMSSKPPAARDSAAARLKGLLALWRRRVRQRRELARLDADALKDVGLDCEAVRRECAKMFWQE
jgi:uncharacterized protein YjiS (DUF1127 family)